MPDLKRLPIPPEMHVPWDPDNSQTIWIVEFVPLPPNGVGGHDWFYDYGDAIWMLGERMALGLRDYSIGLYSIQLPSFYSRDQIQLWTKDNCDVIPRFIDSEYCKTTTRAPSSSD